MLHRNSLETILDQDPPGKWNEIVGETFPCISKPSWLPDTQCEARPFISWLNKEILTPARHQSRRPLEAQHNRPDTLEILLKSGDIYIDCKICGPSISMSSFMSISGDGCMITNSLRINLSVSNEEWITNTWHERKLHNMIFTNSIIRQARI